MNDSVLKHTSLVLLALQNIALSLILPLCRKPDEEGNVFFAPTCVVMIEMIKMVVAYGGLMWKHVDAQRRGVGNGNVYLPIAVSEKGTRSPASNASSSTLLEGADEDHNDNQCIVTVDEEKARTSDEITDYIPDVVASLPITPPADMTTTQRLCSAARLAFTDVANPSAIRMAVPALLYVVQNNLQVFSAGFLPPAEFQVFSQLKLVTTALFLVILLNRKLTAHHWTCIVTLCVGIVFVKGADQLLKRGGAAAALSTPGLWTVGFPAIVGACICSGLAGVYIEMQLKSKTQCFWAGNVQLAGASLLPAMVPLVLDSYQHGRIMNPFRFFTPVVWAMILIHVAGGMLVSMVIKYADNILKGFVVSVSLILTMVASSIITHTPLTLFQCIGGLLVAASTFFYGQAGKAKAAETK